MPAPTPGFLAEELGRIDAGAPVAQAPSLLPTLLNVVFSLALVIGLVYLAYWLLLRWRDRRGLSDQAAKVGLIKVLERHYIDGQRAVAVVEVGDELLTLGLGQDVTLLGKVSDPATVESLRSRAPLSADFMGFKEQLERVGMRLKKDEWGQSKQALRSQSNAMKEQAELLRNEKGKS